MTEQIAIKDIQMADRQRRHFDETALAKLSQSILKKGLMHPVVLRNDGRTLVAGERRCRAVQMLEQLFVDSYSFNDTQIPAGHVPYILLKDLSADDLIEAELEENVLRENLTWQEEADAIAKLHELRVGQIPTQTYKDTATEIAGDKPTSAEQVAVRDSVLLAEHLNDPAIAKAKSKKDALKILRKKKQQALTDQLASQFDIRSTPHIFNCGDFRDFKTFVAAGSVDVICTDPPYGVGADTFGEQAGAAHNYEDSPEYAWEVINDFVVEASRVAKDKAHLYCFCDFRWFQRIADHLGRYGWDVWPSPLIWNKGSGMLPRPDHAPRKTYETIVYALRGNKTVTAIYPDVLTVPSLAAPRYGAEKPYEVYENLLRRSAKPGDLIWEPFAGAGPIFPAANKLALRVVASEMSEEKYNYAKLRMEDEE